MSFSQRNENKKQSIEEILLKIDNFHRVEKGDFSIYKSRPVFVTMETDRRNIIYKMVVVT